MPLISTNFTNKAHKLQDKTSKRQLSERFNANFGSQMSNISQIFLNLSKNSKKNYINVKMQKLFEKAKSEKKS